MKEKVCEKCLTVNVLEFTLRTGNTDTVTIRCKSCKRLLHIKNDAKSVAPQLN